MNEYFITSNRKIIMYFLLRFILHANAVKFERMIRCKLISLTLYIQITTKMEPNINEVAFAFLPMSIVFENLLN